MPSILFRGNVVLPTRLLPQGVVVVENERIVAVDAERDVKVPNDATVVDAADGYISPGYVDIHTHGGAGSDYMDGTPEAVRVANRAHANHGTTTVFPTTTTGTPAQLAAMLDSTEEAAQLEYARRRSDCGYTLVWTLFRQRQGWCASEGF